MRRAAAICSIHATPMAVDAIEKKNLTVKQTDRLPRLMGRRRERMPMTDHQYLDRAEALRGRLYRTAYLMLGRETEAIDAVDEAIYKGYRKHHGLREEAYLETWLTRILIRVCHDVLRRRKRELTVETLPETAQERFDALPLKEAIRALPEPLREIIILRFFTGLTQEETARALQIPRGTVSTRQKRALTLLRLELRDEEGAL